MIQYTDKHLLIVLSLGSVFTIKTASIIVPSSFVTLFGQSRYTCYGTEPLLINRVTKI